MQQATRRGFLQVMAGVGLAAVLPMEAQNHGTRTGTASAVRPLEHQGDVLLRVRELGAVGDGKAKDTEAVQLALDRCSVLGGGKVVFAAGEYLCGTLRIHSNTTVWLDEGATILGSPEIAEYPFTEVRWEGKWLKGYSSLITAQDAVNVRIAGKGRIVASQAIKGRTVNADGSPMQKRATGGPTASQSVARKDVLRHPALMEFVRCKGLVVENIVTEGNDMWSTHPVYCEDVVFRNVTFHSGADGVDVDSCKGVLIEGCTFETKDDCISLKSGRGMEGNTIGIPCEDVVIRNCTMRDQNFACIGIGSETSGGVRNVLVEHCKCLGARSHAVYIKSRPGRGAFLENITVREMDVSGMGQGFLRINTNGSGLQDPDPVPGLSGVPTLKNFRFSNIRVVDVPALVTAGEIHPAKPLQGLVLENISGTCRKGMEIANVRGAVIRSVMVAGYAGPLLAVRNVTGIGLHGAAVLPEMKANELLPEPAEAFVLR